MDAAPETRGKCAGGFKARTERSGMRRQGEWVRFLEQQEAARQCLAVEGDEECRLPTDVCAPKPPPQKPGEDTLGQGQAGLLYVLQAAVPIHQRDVASAAILGIIAFILISQEQ